MDAPIDAVVNTLFDRARAGQLVVCAGAGLSRAAPSSLPSGSDLGERLDTRLRDLINGYESPPNPANLIEVADAGAALDGGKDALRTEVLALAEFSSADPNYGHRATAELLCEGCIQLLLLWNWDTCIERVDTVPELLQISRSRDDLEQLDQPSIAKVHGCESRKATLLITSEDLATPPPWADSTIRDRLRDKTVLFIGVGDVADYARRRLEELRDELSRDGDERADLDIWIVSPTIRSAWAESDWAALVPTLDEQRRIEMGADDFLDQLARRWVREAFDQLIRAIEGEVRPEVRAALDVVRGALFALGSVLVLRWCRRAALAQQTGASVINTVPIQELFVAYAVLASENATATVTARTPAALEIGDRRIEALVACETLPASKVQQRARARAEELANQGTIVDAAEFLVAGVIFGSLADDPEAQLDVALGETESEDVATGTHGVRLSFINASQLRQAA